jgi:hypothetical protein
MMTGLVLWLALVIGGAANMPQARQDTADTKEPLRLRVSPAICLEPGLIQVTVRISGNPDNRALSITVDSPDYYTSSTTTLDGDREAATKVFAYRSLPSGQYTVTAKLRTGDGRAAVAAQDFQVLGRADGDAGR